MKTVKLDMHLHSEYSHDGCLSIPKIVELAKEKGMNALAVTDHNTIESYNVARRYASDDFLVIPAVEYTTTRGHILVYFIEKHAKEDGLVSQNFTYEFEDIIEFVKNNDGLAFAAHIFKHVKKPHDPSAFSDVLSAVCGVEVYNGRCSALYSACNASAKKIAEAGKTPFSAGSDGHAKHEMFRAYRIFEFQDDEKITLQSLKAKFLEPTGSYYCHPTPAVYLAYTKLRLSLISRNIKRIVKYLVQICYCLVFDLSRLVGNAFTGSLKPSVRHIGKDA